MSDKWRFVSVSQCVWTIIFCVIAACVLFIPFSVGFENGTVLAFAKMPLIGDGEYLIHASEALEGLKRIVSNEMVLSIIGFFVNNNFYAYFGILILTICFATALAICRNNIVRIVFRVFSIIFACIMILLFFSYLAFFVGSTVYYLSVPELTDFSLHFLTGGLISNFGFMLFSFILIFRFFKWFTRPY